MKWDNKADYMFVLFSKLKDILWYNFHISLFLLYVYRVNTCPSCQTKFPICIVSGRPLMDLNSVWTCQTCHHRAYEQDITLKQNCPLCHAAINE